MLLKILKSVLGARSGPEQPSAPAVQYAGPQHQGFVAFIANIEGPHFLVQGDRVESDQASLRLRVSIPARELLRRAPVCLIPLAYVEQYPKLSALGTVRAIVIGKFPVEMMMRNPQRFLALADWAQMMSKRVTVVADFSDDLAAAADMHKSLVLKKILGRMSQACALTAPSEALAARLIKGAAHGVTVIEDPYEDGTSGKPRFAPKDVLRLVWFGVIAPGQGAYLQRQFAAIARRLAPRAIDLAMVTNSANAASVEEMASALRAANPQCALRFVSWSREDQLREIAQSDLVLLPQDADSAWGSVKSHNRLVESLRAGRFAVASPIPAYLELQDVAWVGSDLAEGVEWALTNPAEVLARISTGQRKVAERFAPQRIAEKWAAVLRL